jgi:hypothetical protein
MSCPQNVSGEHCDHEIANVFSTLPDLMEFVERVRMLFVGDDWAEAHHDIEIVDEDGKRLVRRRLPEGLEGISRLHALIAAAMPPEWAELDDAEAAGRVKVGIETERGPWVAALVAAAMRCSRSTRKRPPATGAAFDVGGEKRSG